MGSTTLRERILDYLKGLVAEITRLDAARIGASEPLEAYGIDSIMVTNLNEALDRRFSGLPRTLFFEYRTLGELADYFVREHAAAFAETAQSAPATALRPSPLPPPEAVAPQVIGAAGGSVEPLADSGDEEEEEEWLSIDALLAEERPEPGETPAKAAGGPGAGAPKAATVRADIAIIGLEGRYPMAADLDRFWDNLLAGKDCITEVPAERWDHQALYSPDRDRDDKVYTKWGGFLDQVDRFEPLFFNISPREAATMDPQERLFLQTAWKTFEDAGYTRESLRGTGVGVFVGVMWGLYQLYGVEETLHGRLGATSSSYAGIANRVSYLFDLSGPSIALDTMCSSSLTAIHWACRSLLEGECDMALAGGVNLTLHPNKYVHLSRGQFASSDGRCRSFGEGGDGYVPGEGVGAVLLKPLARAQRDGDHVYGVIKATAINHGGKTNGYTVPNPTAQARVIRSALESAAIDPADIGYLEAHGTGTALGDPIEMAGLMASLGERLAQAGGHCALGSVKSNIGHLESASGIAGLTKVLLQMRHARLVPSLHSERLNPNIHWEEVPFRVQHEAAVWRPRRAGEPLRAGLSSFGAGGANAHLIVESYTPPAAVEVPGPHLVPLSAADEEHLRHYARTLAERLGREPRPTLASVAHSLQIGREAMDERLALVVNDLDQLRSRLQGFVDGNDSGLYRGRAEASELDQIFSGDAAAEFLRRLSEQRDWPQLARLWVMGCNLDWRALHGEDLAPLVSLPTYPFAGKRYWAAQQPAYTGGPAAPPAAPSASPPGGKKQRLLQPVWRPWQAPPAGPLPSGRLVLLCAPAGEGLARRVADAAPDLQTLVVSGEPEDAAAGQRLAAELAAATPPLQGVIDLCDLDGGEAAEGVSSDYLPRGRLALLQALIASGRELRWLHLTRACVPYGAVEAGPQGWGKGAVLRGFVAMLSAEYRHVRATTLDLDTLHGDVAEALQRAWASAGEVGQLCYRDGAFHALALEPCVGQRQELRIDPAKVYLITGGTGGIGLQVATWLTRRGATRLALTGVRPLPAQGQWAQLLASGELDPATSAKLRTIQALPAEVELHFGELGDEAALAGFIHGIEQRLGALGGVVHCAGLVKEEYPAFIEKPMEDMAVVLGPKVEGLEVLRRVLAGQPLAFFALCSSVAALAPSLAVGVADYAAANAYMNLVAERDQRSGGVMQSIVWPNWTDVGLGKTHSPRYAALGLEGIDNAMGLALLEQCLELPQPVVAPLVVDPARFDPAALLGLRPPAPAPAAAPGPASAGVAATTAAAAGGSHAGATTGAGDDEQALVDALRRQLAPVLYLQPEEWKAGASFESLGVDSVLIASINKALESWLGVSLDPGILLEYPSLEALAGYLHAEQGAALAAAQGMAAGSQGTAEDGGPGGATAQAPVYERRQVLEPPAPPSAPPAPPLQAGAPHPAASGRQGEGQTEGFAVVGMACRFPQSPTLEIFRENLYAGFDGIREVPPSRWDIGRWYHPDEYRKGKSISKWGGFVDDVEWFEPRSFDLDEVVAPQVDPLLRLALETGIEALRDAGYTKEDVNGRSVGVYLGSRVANYADRIGDYEKNSVVATGQVFFAAHLAHVLNLKGPAFVLDSACSSSLLAIHQACRSLADGDAEMALAGGVDILLDERPYLMLSEARALSPSGRCRTFDEGADGFVPGEGCGVIVLKPLARALADGDRIYALIEGSAVNNDGRTMGITTPNPQQQQAVIRAAWQRAGADPASIGYMETHGTGTRIGDPIELKALTAVLGNATDERGYCAIGSIKSNVGHLLSAAGVAAFIKTALCIHGGMLVPTLHCHHPNPRFAFAESPFYPNTELRPWEPRQGIRRAGVTALGFGGTNVHLVASDGHLQHSGYAPRRQPLAPVPCQRQYYWLPAREGSGAAGAAGLPQLHTPAPLPAKRVAGYRFNKRY